MHHQLRAQLDVGSKPFGQQPLDIRQAKIRHDAGRSATGSTNRSTIERNIATPSTCKFYGAASDKIPNFERTVFGFYAINFVVKLT